MVENAHVGHELIAPRMQTNEQYARRARIEHMLRRSSATFLATTLVHELSQPITAINSWSAACLRLMSEEPDGREKIAERLGFVTAESHRATNIIRAFKAVVHRQIPELVDVDVNEVLSWVADLVAEDAQTAGIALSLVRADLLPPVRADQDMVAIAALILCRNSLDALKFHDGACKQLEIVSMAVENSGVVVMVRDTGPGLDRESAARLFEPLSSTKPYGVGIELPLCRALVEGLGGRLWLEKNAPSGATFAFELPSTLDGEEGDGTGTGESTIVRGGR